jgi:hypothetical protein
MCTDCTVFLWLKCVTNSSGNSLATSQCHSSVSLCLISCLAMNQLPRLAGWLWWVRLTSQTCGLYGPTVHPRVTAMWTMVWWYLPGLTPNLSTRALWQPQVVSGGPVSWDISGASRRVEEGNENVVYQSPKDFKKSSTCRKILWHWTSGFTSHPKDGVLRIFIALKNPTPWPGSNLWPLGQVASTLTTTRLRRQPAT